MYFNPGDVDETIPDEYTNRLVDFISEDLAANHNAFGNTVFENISLPGVSIDQSLSDRDKTVGSVLDAKVFSLPADQQPDLVIYTVSRIDVNRDDIWMEQLLPILVERISEDVVDLTQAGIQTVIIPALPVNDRLYHVLMGGAELKLLNERVNMLNDAINAADLPVLPIRYIGLDTDQIPGPDEIFYSDYTVPEFAVYGITTDGVHLAEVGQRAAATDIVDGFAGVIFDADHRWTLVRYSDHVLK